jgi:peptidoglycan/xylan/chitin deacetylase (PgdA/CDA1 family)
MSEPELAPWHWPEQRWREAVQRVRAGRRLRPAAWPGGARVAVALSFDSDHETIMLREGDTHPGRLSQGEYGARAGTPRVLALLSRYSVRASFFVPGVSAQLHPDEVRACADQGHEVGLHGWIHEPNSRLQPAVERELYLRSADVLEQLAGRRPVGIRTPSWDFGEGTVDVIRELGLRYDSSLMADDEPYELLVDGEPSGLVEVPVEWIRDDAPYFSMDRRTGTRPYTSPRQVLSIWVDEFERARREGGLFQLTMHPHIIGHRSRIVVLEELVERIAGSGEAWFATHAQVAAESSCADSAGQPA